MVKVEGIQFEILQVVAHIRETTSSPRVEDVRIAEEIGLGPTVIRSALQSLEEAGYVDLEKSDPLSGIAYHNVALTSAGEAALDNQQ